MVLPSWSANVDRTAPGVGSGVVAPIDHTVVAVTPARPAPRQWGVGEVRMPAGGSVC